ncbi:MAG: type II toxin-antitoxin system HicB family antitoxin [Verrucomicrobiota bacterium]
MTYGILFERIDEPGFPPGCYYAHVPSLGLTTHGEGIEGARTAARDLVRLWVAEKQANGEAVPHPAETFYSTLEVNEDALQGA